MRAQVEIIVEPCLFAYNQSLSPGPHTCQVGVVISWGWMTPSLMTSFMQELRSRSSIPISVTENFVQYFFIHVFYN